MLSLNDAAALLARSTSSQSTASASHDIQRFLTDLGQRIATRTIVLCKAVDNAGNGSPDIASSQAADRHYTLTTENAREKNQRPTQRLSDYLKERANVSTGNRHFVGKVPERPDDTTYFRSVGNVSNLSGPGTIHRLRHRRHHHHRQAGDRKHILASPFNRKYYSRRSRRADVQGCEGRRVDDDVAGELDVERVTAIMKAFYCWDDEVDRLTSHLRRSADGHLRVTSSTSQLRCRLMRRYDDCRRNFIDKVFRTGHGFAISWPRQITDVMDRVDNAIYY